jgi:RHS repeat-associated protein
MDGVDVARLWWQVSLNVYGEDEFGPTTSTMFFYDDTYGYNFVSQTTTNHVTGMLVTTYTPDLDALDEAKWLVGLVDVKEQLSGLMVQSREVYDYTANGQLESRARDIGLRDGTAATDVATTSWTYDSYGNVKTQTESRGKDAAGIPLSSRVLEFCYDGDGGGGGNWCPSLPGGTPETHSLRVGVKDAIGGVIEFEHDWTTGSVLHVERDNESGDFRDSMTVVRDAFGRVTEKWFHGASFGGGDPDVQLSATTYQDAPVGGTPAYVERFRFAEETGGTSIRTASYLDGFGNSFRTVEKTPSGYRGSAVFRNPVTRITRSVGPVACNLADPSCSVITETTVPYSEQKMDEVGRVVRVTTPDGEALTEYKRIQRVQPMGGGSPDWFDAIESSNSENQMTRRVMDGNRVVWVDECLDYVCANTPDSTFYTYEATGEISTIYDAIATSTGDFTSPARYLRYHYDTLGRVIQTDEPNTGSSSAKYDHQGNLTAATNVRNMTTRTYYDPLGRVTSIDRPAGVGEWDLDFTYDAISRMRDGVTTPDSEYEDAWEYDDFGRATRQTRSYYDAMVMDFDYDLLDRPTKIGYPSTGSSATYSYEGAYLTEVCRGEVACASTALRYRLITDVVYDDLGRREDVVSTSGTVHREYYGIGEEDGRLVNGLKRLAITGGAAAGALDFNYKYDSIGNIESIDDQSTTYDGSSTYSYDARNRLWVWRDASGVSKRFDYDALGNLVKHGGSDQVFDTASKPHQIISNRAGEDYEYDLDGNVNRRGSTFFVYNSANQLVCTGSAEGVCDGPGYRYDADGQLLWDGATGEQLMGDLFKWKSQGKIAYSNIVAFGEVIAEVKQQSTYLRAAWVPIGWPLPIPKAPFQWALAGAGVVLLIGLLAWLGAGSAFSESPATVTAALVLAGLLVVPPPAWGMGGGGSRTVTTVRNFYRDHLGSAAYITGPNVRQAYEPFGKPILTPTGADDEFTSKEYHGATEMYNFGARWYDAEAGRFAGVDPLVVNAGDPQSLNAYSYVRNDPINLIDPNGMEYMEEITIHGVGPTAGPNSISSGSLTFSFSTPRVRFNVTGGRLYVLTDVAGTNNSDPTECCGADQSAGGDSSQSEDTPYDLAAAGPDAIDQLRRLADSINLIDAMKEAEREVERLWVDGKKNGKEKYADADAWAWKGMHFQREPNNPFLEAFDHWSVEVVRTPAGTPRDSVPEPRPLSIGSGGVKWIRPPTIIYCANCPSGVGF